MMTAVNAPFDDLNLNVGAMKYGLAHLAIDNDQYLDYLRVKDRYTILDNAADELGEGMTGDDLNGLVEEIQPSELILPDVLKDGKATQEASMSFYENYLAGDKRPEGLKLMAVAQGETYYEWMESYNFWNECDFVDVIGVPYDIDFPVGVDKGGTFTKTELRSLNRQALVSSLYYNKGRKPIHLLGMNNLRELEMLRDSGANRRGFIRSNDTTGPFAAALYGMDWSTMSASEKRFEKDWPALDFEHVWDREEKFLAYKNLMAYAVCTGDHGLSYNLGRVFPTDELMEGFDRG